MLNNILIGLLLISNLVWMLIVLKVEESYNELIEKNLEKLVNKK